MARDGEDRRTPRLDQPLERSRTLRPTYDPETFGRLSERVARYIGSWGFIAWMTAFVVIWIGWNVAAPVDLRPDPFPFIFLTLLLSLQASYAAPLILLAQNRQADRDRVQYQDDRARTERLLADAEFLAREIAALRMAVGDVATRDFVRSELRDLLAELDSAADRPGDRAGDRTVDRTHARPTERSSDRSTERPRDRPAPS
ncbi:MAG: DUF1003 domain-containing protein [Actinomycetota bacterium]|nr:MAG: DUF1003 domain-containing protein [Actinomycetota bacterium]